MDKNFEEKLNRVRILWNIKRYLEFEGIDKSDDLFFSIDKTLDEAKSKIEPENKSYGGVSILMDLLHRKVDFTTDISTLKENLYVALKDTVKNLYENEENVEIKVTLSKILEKFKDEKYKEEFYEYIKEMNSFDKEIEYTEVEGFQDIKIGSPKTSQFEKDLQWIIMLDNEKKPNQNGQKQYIDGGGIDWNNREYKASVDLTTIKSLDELKKILPPKTFKDVEDISE